MNLVSRNPTAARLAETALECLHDIPNPAAGATCRRLLRYTAALLPRDMGLESAARLLSRVADHPRLTPDDVLQALREADGDETLEALREAAAQARSLRGRDPWRTLELMRGNPLIRRMSVWLFVVEGRADALAQSAARRVSGGWITAGIDGTPAGDDPDAADVQDFADRHGVSVGYAVTLMCRAASSDADRRDIAAAGARSTARAGYEEAQAASTSTRRAG